MRFRETAVHGVFEVIIDPAEDERGYFARTWCVREFAEYRLPAEWKQASISHNTKKGTLRGLHYQRPPSREGKLVRCEQGVVYDVALDLRPDSQTFLRHVAVELEASLGNALFIPPGVAHGFQTVVDNTRVLYMMSDFYAPELAGGVRFNDPAFGINWPLEVSVIAARDREYPRFNRAEYVRSYAGWVTGQDVRR